MPIFYRAVSMAELEDIRVAGELRAGPNSLERKHLVGTLEHARAFGSMLYGNEKHGMISVEVTEAAARRFFHFAMLDSIGAAWFAEIADLRGANVREVTS